MGLTALALAAAAQASLILSSSDISGGGTLDLGSFQPGAVNYQLPARYTVNNNSAYPGIALRCKNDTAGTWYLTLAGSALTHVTSGQVLASSALQCMPTYAQYSANNAVLSDNLMTTTFVSMTGSAVTLYRSLSGTDYNITTGSNYVEVRTQFAAVVPGSAAPGEYNSSLTFTLTE